MIEQHKVKSIMLQGEGPDAETIYSRLDVTTMLVDLASVNLEYPPQNVYNMNKDRIVLYMLAPANLLSAAQERLEEQSFLRRSSVGTISE